MIKALGAKSVTVAASDIKECQVTLKYYVKLHWEQVSLALLIHTSCGIFLKNK